jgi:tRNA threonylcarbamoyladenosine biosynthesis protein TsaB
VADAGAAAGELAGSAVILLALESATDLVGAAVIRPGDGHPHDGVGEGEDGGEGEGASAERSHAGGRAHAELLAPAVEEVCALVGSTVHDIDRIAVDVGPGLFTGLRVGVATAKALAQALGIGVLGVSSLDILAAAARERSGVQAAGPVVAVVDARRGEVFAAAYHFEPVAGRSPAGADRAHWADAPDPATVREDHPEPMTPAAVEAWLADLARTHDRVTVVGDGAVRYREQWRAHGSLDFGLAGELSAPPPLVQARLALRRLAVGAALSAPAELVPDYRRPADARINWDQRAPQSGRDGAEGARAAGTGG